MINVPPCLASEELRAHASLTLHLLPQHSIKLISLTHSFRYLFSKFILPLRLLYFSLEKHQLQFLAYFGGESKWHLSCMLMIHGGMLSCSQCIGPEGHYVQSNLYLL